MAGLLRRASRPKERPGESSGGSTPTTSSPREPERAPSSPGSPITASPRRQSRKEDDGSFEISELMRQLSIERHQRECDAHQKTKIRLFEVESELNVLKGLPPPARSPVEEEMRSTPKMTAAIAPLNLAATNGASPSAPSSPTTNGPSSTPSSPTSSTTSSPNSFFKTTGRQVGRLLAGGSSQRGERRAFGVRLEAVMSSPADLPRAIGQALGFIGDSEHAPYLIDVSAVTAGDVDGSSKTVPLGDIKHQVEKGVTIDFSALSDGKQKAQHLLYRFLIELPEPLVPLDAAPHLLAAKVIPVAAWRQRRIYLAICLGLPPLHRSVFEAYLSTFHGLVVRAGKPIAAAAAPQVSPETEQLERMIAHLDGTLQRISEAAARQSSPDTLTAARDFAKDVQDRITLNSPPALTALRNEFSRHAKSAMTALKGVLTASPGVLSVQLQGLRECCERVKSSATALRNGLAPPQPPPAVVEENIEAKVAAAAKIAAVITSVLFGGAEEKDVSSRPPLVKQVSSSTLSLTSSPSSVYATIRGRSTSNRSRASDAGDMPLSIASASPSSVASTSSPSLVQSSVSVAGTSKTALVQTLLLEWNDIMAVEKLSHVLTEEGKPVLNGASVDVCVDKILEVTPMDSEFRPLLLSTHCYVMTSEEFLAQLLSRYAPSPITPFERDNNSALEATLKTWFGTCTPAAPEPLLAQLHTYAGQTSSALRFVAADLQALSRTKTAVLPPSLVQGELSTPFPGVKLKLDVSTLDVMTLDPDELAQQILLIDLELFYAIPSHEFLLGNASKAGRAPMHSRLVDSYNTWARWIAGEVLAVADAQRVECLTHCIRVAETCRKIGNFNAAFALYCGISLSSITRLESIWTKVPRRWMEKYEEMQMIFSSKQDFKKLRAEMKKIPPHCVVVPYTGLYTKWLVAIEENNRTFLENNLINLSKLRLIYRLIKEIQSYQSRGPAPYLPSPELKRTLLAVKPMTEDQLWERSLVVEPSARPPRPRGNTTSGHIIPSGATGSSSDLLVPLPSPTQRMESTSPPGGTPTSSPPLPSALPSTSPPSAVKSDRIVVDRRSTG